MQSPEEEGYRVVLVNSNPATIMTDPGFADSTYIEPINWQAVEKIIEAEKPDVLLPTMGGQTALNCALDLEREGVLKKHGVQMIGATKEAIDKAEDREKFKVAMQKIGLETVQGDIAHSMDDALTYWEILACRLLSGLHSQWVEPEGALPTINLNLWRFVSVAWMRHQLMSC